MFKSYLQLAIRQMLKNKLFITINILGMAVALACCIVAYYLYDFNETFDSHHTQSTTIYRVSSIREFQNSLTKYGHSPLALGGIMMEQQGDVEQIVRYTSGSINTRVKDLVFNETVVYTDPEFFDLFTFELLYGTLSLSDKSSIVLGQDIAIKYFGKVDVVGEEILQLLDSGKTKLFTVAGVFKKQPNNSSFLRQAYIHFDNQKTTSPTFDENDWQARSLLYVQVPDESRVKQVEARLQPYTVNNNHVREDFIIQRFVLEPFVGLAKSDSYNNTRGALTNYGAHISAVIGTAAMGIFILLIACFNLTNTAIAVSSRRLKEIGIRKVMGSMRSNIIQQYVSEVFLICLIALIVGLALTHYLLIPAFNSLWSFWALTPDYFADRKFLIFLFIVLVSTSLLAGSYPAFYISRFNTIQILRGKMKFGGTNGFTFTLLSLQLVISLAAIVCSMAFIANAKYQQELDMGFNKNEVVFTSVNNGLEFEALKNAMTQMADVKWVAASHHQIGASYISDPVKSGDKELEVDILDIGDNYLITSGITLLEGRDFIKDSETDKRESVIITENMASAFGWNKPIGQEITWMDTVRYRVIGVVKNIMNKGMMSRLDPVMLRYAGNERANFFVVSAPIDKIGSVKARLEREAKQLFPNRMTTVHYMYELVENSLQVNNSILKMFIFLGVLATFLSATGLYTLTSLNIIKRMKEIGLRKMLGASVGNIARIINKEFLIILSIASVLGGYLGTWLASMLLDSIWEHFERISLLTVMSSIAIILAASTLSIAYKIYSTIRINPVTILKSE